MKEDKAFDPVDVGLLGLVTIVPESDEVMDLVEQFRPSLGGNRDEPGRALG